MNVCFKITYVTSGTKRNRSFFFNKTNSMARVIRSGFNFLNEENF